MRLVPDWLALWGPRVAVVVAVSAGVVGLGSAVGLAIAVAAAALALLASFAWFNEVAGRLVGAVIVGALVLFAANIGLHSIGVRPPILLGLALAIVIFGAPAAWYLRGTELAAGAILGRGTRWDWVVAVNVAALLAVLLIVDAPIVAARGDAWPAVGGSAVFALVLLMAGVWGFAQHTLPRWLGAAVGTVVLAVVPLLVIAPQANQTVANDRAAATGGLGTRIDVRIVTDGRPHRGRSDLSHIPADPAFAAIDVHFSVGYRDGEGVRWTLTGGDRTRAVRAIAAGRSAARTVGPPRTRRGADAILLLLVDGTPPVVGKPGSLPAKPGSPGQIGLWRRVSHHAGGRTMPAFALLQTGDHRRSRARLRRWQHFSPTGGAASVNALRRRVITEAGVALAVSSPTAQADLSLAITHRPILLFDDDEPVPRPLSVGWLFDTGRVRLCDDAGDDRIGDCPVVRDPARLRNGATHLQIDQPKDAELQALAKAEQAAHTTAAPPAQSPGQLPAATLAPLQPPTPARGAGDPPTTIYVHPVSIELGNQRLLYLDYWWYLSDNPVQVGDGALCGAGLVIARVTCHNHVSDWEGLTVVIDRTQTRPKVVAVNYGQHDSVVRYGWNNLRAVWDQHPASFPALGADDRRNRPLAYVAKGSHATYPLPCLAATCAQVAGGPNDSRHDGRRAWLGNYNTNTCETAGCVRELPTTAQGQKATLWNAYAGLWGSDHCALTYYCDASQPPPAPGRQARYRSPSDCDGTATVTVTTSGRQPVFTPDYNPSRSCH